MVVDERPIAVVSLYWRHQSTVIDIGSDDGPNQEDNDAGGNDYDGNDEDK